jgi:hypothetical protein
MVEESGEVVRQIEIFTRELAGKDIGFISL